MDFELRPPRAPAIVLHQGDVVALGSTNAAALIEGGYLAAALDVAVPCPPREEGDPGYQLLVEHGVFIGPTSVAFSPGGGAPS